MRRFSLRSFPSSFWISGVSIAALVAVLFLPEFAHAASTTFFGPIISDACNCPTSAPGWGCVLATFQNVMSFAVSLATVIITVFIALAGFTYMTSGASAEKRQLANKRLTNAVIGLLIVLCAYLIVDSIMKIIYNPNQAGFGPWNSILGGQPGEDCLAPRALPNALPALFGSSASNNANGGNAVSTKSPVVGAGCPVQTSGPCSASNFSGFGDQATANTFSQICFNESGNGNLLQSTVDKTTDGQPVSFGLFQINISANPIGNLNCPSAFNAVYTSSNHNVHITNPGLYAQCKAAGLNPNQNIAEAQALYRAHGLSPWLADKIKCGISLLGNPDSIALAACDISG